MSKLFQYGGIVASVVPTVFGAGSIVTYGRDRVHSDLAREQIVVRLIDHPYSTRQQWHEGRGVAKAMRKHTLEATGGETRAEMGAPPGKNGKPTNDAEAPAVNAKTGEPVDNPLRNLWVTETALTTALHFVLLRRSWRPSLLSYGLRAHDHRLEASRADPSGVMARVRQGEDRAPT